MKELLNKQQPRQPFHWRLWIYQRERFPLLAHGVTLAVFSYTALCVSSLLRGVESWPAFAVTTAAFVSTLFFYFQLRVADEFKDFDDDRTYRPYRPVPRGLVTLSELRTLGLVTAVLQLGIAVPFGLPMVGLLLVVWAYFGLMAVEFLVGSWLRKHALIYMLSHMVIVPLTALYAAAFDWLLHAGTPPDGFVWFLALAFFGGMIFEIGRKIRAPEQEERGVETYTALWGIRRAVIAWFAVVALACLAAFSLSAMMDVAGPGGIVPGVVAVSAAVIAFMFVRRPAKRRAKAVEAFSGLGSLALYANAGFLPLFLERW